MQAMQWKTINLDPRLNPRLSARFMRQAGVRSPWPMSLAVLSTAAVVAIPLLVVLVVAAAVGTTVYLLASAVDRLVGGNQGGRGNRGSREDRGSGNAEAEAPGPLRENVRVVTRP